MNKDDITTTTKARDRAATIGSLLSISDGSNPVWEATHTTAISNTYNTWSLGHDILGRRESGRFAVKQMKNIVIKYDSATKRVATAMKEFGRIFRDISNGNPVDTDISSGPPAGQLFKHYEKTFYHTTTYGAPRGNRVFQRYP